MKYKLIRLVQLIKNTSVNLAIWLKNNYRSRLFIYGLSTAILLILAGIIAYRIIFPPVLVSPDYGPFQNQEEYDDFIEKNPLIVAQAPQDQKFSKSAQIRQDKQVIYTIKLSQRPIKPNMDKAYAESYLAYLQESQDNAKEWIRNQGQDPNKLNIVWRPNPQEMRSKMLGESTSTIPQKDAAPSATPTPTPTPTPGSSGPRFPQ